MLFKLRRVALLLMLEAPGNYACDNARHRPQIDLCRLHREALAKLFSPYANSRPLCIPSIEALTLIV